MPVLSQGIAFSCDWISMYAPLFGCALIASALGSFANAREDNENASESIVSNIRQALGSDALERHAGGFLLEGTADHNGLESQYSLAFTPGGLFHREIRGRLHDAVAYDGVTAWGVDWSRTPRVLALEDLEVQQTLHWVQTGRWLAAESPFALSVVADESDERQVCLRMRLKGGILEAKLLVDRATWQPRQLRRRWFAGEETWLFENYQRSHGCFLAHKVAHKRAELTDTFEVQSVREISTSSLRGSFGPLRPELEDTRFDAKTSSRITLMQSSTGHLFVRPRIDGKDVGWFALDTGTGAGMTIAPASARALGMESLGRTMSVGAGKAVMTTFRQGKTFELGPITITDGVYLELPAEFVDLLQKGFGIEVAGTCGYDVFSRAVVELDLESKTIDLHDPARYQLAAGRWEELTLNHKIPCVRCRFNGDHEGMFQLDTGASNGTARMVLLHAPAVESLQLVKGRNLAPIKVGGVGGTVDARIGTLDKFVVGGRPYHNMTALFMITAQGALADPYTTGTFGGAILEPFRVVFDYPHRRIAFVEKSNGGH